MTTYEQFRSLTIPTVLSALLVTAATFAQQPATSYKPPRLADGKPSFEGNWTNASLTTLQRPARYKKLVIPPDEVEAATNNHPQVVRQRTDDKQDKDTALDGSDLRSGRGYNSFWIDPGMKFSNIKGEYRTSFIVDPEDGQIPFKQAPRATFGEGSVGREPRGSFDGPEARPLGERCIINSGSAGPPMLTYLYNNNYEIVQTHDNLVIRAEMNNYARVVRIGGTHVSPSITPFHGDSIGHWEGDTLVVETTNFHPLHANGLIGLGKQSRVIERFTRYSKDQLLYEFTVDDPQRYKQPWRGEMSFNATKDHVYEYACHEGNYALSGTLSGAREEEKRAAAKK